MVDASAVPPLGVRLEAGEERMPPILLLDISFSCVASGASQGHAMSVVCFNVEASEHGDGVVLVSWCGFGNFAP